MPSEKFLPTVCLEILSLSIQVSNRIRTCFTCTWVLQAVYSHCCWSQWSSSRQFSRDRAGEWSEWQQETSHHHFAQILILILARFSSVNAGKESRAKSKCCKGRPNMMWYLSLSIWHFHYFEMLTVLSVRLSGSGSRKTSSPILARQWMALPNTFTLELGMINFII